MELLNATEQALLVDILKDVSKQSNDTHKVSECIKLINKVKNLETEFILENVDQTFLNIFNEKDS